MGKGYESKFCELCCKRFFIKNIRFYKVPQCEVKRQRWVDTCGLVFTPNAFVCEKHFSETDFIYGSKRRRLSPSALPLLLVETPETSHDCTDATDEILQSEPTMIDCGIQTEGACSYKLKMHLMKNKIKLLKAENAKLLRENNKMKASLKSINTDGQANMLIDPDVQNYLT